jgi:hypothetical protein
MGIIEDVLRESVGPREAWAMVNGMCKMKPAEQEAMGRMQLEALGSDDLDQKAAMRMFWNVFDAYQSVAFDGKRPSLMQQNRVPKGYSKRRRWFRE